MRRSWLPSGLLTVLLASGVPAPAQEPRSPDDPKSEEAEKAGKKARTKPATADEVPLFTNEDLDRLGPDPYAARPSKAGAPAGAPAEDAPKPPEDPLRKLEDDQLRAAGQAARTAAAEREVADAEAAVREIGKRALAVRNPLLSPPVPPPERVEAWKTMNGAERAAATEADLQEAKKRLEDAKARLEKLRAGAKP